MVLGVGGYVESGRIRIPIRIPISRLGRFVCVRYCPGIDLLDSRLLRSRLIDSRLHPLGRRSLGSRMLRTAKGPALSLWVGLRFTRTGRRRFALGSNSSCLLLFGRPLAL